MKKKRQRKQITVTVDPDNVRFADRLVSRGIFWNRSMVIDHALELEYKQHRSMMKHHYWYRDVYNKKKEE